MGFSNAPLKATPEDWYKSLDGLSLLMLKAFMKDPSIRGKGARTTAQKAGYSPYSGEKVLRRVRATFGLTAKRATGSLEVTDEERWELWKSRLPLKFQQSMDGVVEVAPIEPEEVEDTSPVVVVDDQIALVEYEGQTFEAPIPEEAEVADDDDDVPWGVRLAISNMQTEMARYGLQSVTVTPDGAEFVQVQVTARRVKLTERVKM